ncbi:MAG: DUF4270 family protein [Bacteroidota bacterium]|nr:DUF4270 family protein [Bacteroidota bacterium]MDP4211508.1 DUF4270 family protein [Bacteroidota bacterium]MDP4249723.1 DUF4270 family protein [Bacteroidota bacterium]
MTRKSFFRHHLYLYLLAFLLIPGAFSCTKPAINFDSNFGSDNSTNVVVVDTFEIKVSTVFLDSFPTSGTGTMLIGEYQDPYLGTISSRSFSEITYPALLPTLTNLSTYDSIQLIFRISKTFYGDTTKVQRYLVSQLTGLLDYPYLQAAFYNKDSIPYDPNILGSADVQINPTAGYTSQKTGDSIKINLPDALGRDFFKLLYNHSDTVKNKQTFRGYFKGLTIYPDLSKPGAAYGFKDSMFVRLYYHEPGVVQQLKFIDFPYVNKSNQFNQISYNRTGTSIQNIGQQNNEIPSAATGNMAFLQPSTSLYVKLLFPTINRLLQYQDYLSVLKAQLVIKAVDGTYSPLLALPPQINLAMSTQANTMGSTLSAGTGNLNVDYLYGANTSYSYDITSYIQQKILLGVEDNRQNGLFLTVPAPAYNTSFNRLVVGDQFNPFKVNQISLRIFYASYY